MYGMTNASLAEDFINIFAVILSGVRFEMEVVQIRLYWDQCKNCTQSYKIIFIYSTWDHFHIFSGSPYKVPDEFLSPASLAYPTRYEMTLGETYCACAKNIGGKMTSACVKIGDVKDLEFFTWCWPLSSMVLHLKGTNIMKKRQLLL